MNRNLEIKRPSFSSAGNTLKSTSLSIEVADEESELLEKYGTITFESIGTYPFPTMSEVHPLDIQTTNSRHYPQTEHFQHIFLLSAVFHTQEDEGLSPWKL